MIDLFYRGEPLYMSVLTLLLFAILTIGTIAAVFIVREKEANPSRIRRYLSYLRSVGLFSLIFGLFTQLLGLYGAFTAIKEWGSVSSTVLATGLWTSSVPSLYGGLIFLFSYLLRWALRGWSNRTNITA